VIASAFSCGLVDPTTTAAVTTSTTIRTTLEPGTFSLANLQSDYDTFLFVIEYNPRLYTDDTVTDALIISQRALLFNGMTELEFFRVLAPLAASLNCGHTGVRLSPETEEIFYHGNHDFPVPIRLFGDELTVVGTEAESLLTIGDIIVSINGNLISDLVAMMLRNLSSDGTNTTLKYASINQSFMYYYFAFVETVDVVTVEYLDVESQTTKTATIELGEYRDPWNATEYVPFSATYDVDYAVLTMRDFYPWGSYDMQDYYDFIEAFFVRVANDGIDNVILDVRGNSGGDPMITSRLFSYLAAESQPYFASSAPNIYPGLKSDVPLSDPHFDGNLYTLIDGFCFSSCGHLLALLAYQDIGVFVGTESGGSFACTDNSVESILPNTNLHFRCSRTVWAVAVEGLTPGRGILPDVEIVQSVADYVAGIDTVFESTIAMIRGE